MATQNNTSIAQNKINGEGGNTKSPSRFRNWVFTLNNFTIEERSFLENTFISKNWKYLFQEEMGVNNTPHLQGFFVSSNPVAFTTLKNINDRWHLEKMNGSIKNNISYCTKSICRIPRTSIHSNIQYESNEQKILQIEYNNDNILWKNWQKEILGRINNLPDKRKIFWYWDETGGIGKSFLTKYILLKYNDITIIGEGRSNDVFNQIKIFMDENKTPQIIILDIPRHNENYINYGCIEKIKNGCIYSGKYEGGVCLFPIPHVFIFANFYPDTNKWSTDRYIIKDLEELTSVDDD